MSDSRECNPLSVEKLGRNAVRKLTEYPSAELPPPAPFNGVGVHGSCRLFLLPKKAGQHSDLNLNTRHSTFQTGYAI